MSASEARDGVLDGTFVEPVDCFVGILCVVRSEDHRVELRERVVCGERFLLEGVECGTCDPPLVQRSDECGLVDEFATSGVDEVPVRPEAVEFVRADHVLGLRCQRVVETDHVGLIERFLSVDGLDARLLD